MGKRLKFQGKASLSFAVWASEIKAFHDWSVQEITSLFNPAVFDSILPEFQVHSQAGPGWCRGGRTTDHDHCN